MKAKIITFCELAQTFLEDGKEDFANLFVRFKLNFFKLYQNGFIFSTRFGADFFTEVARRVRNNEPIKPEPGQKLGEYDANFNKWLDALV
jgi:hypothetical protein